jgi:hypothetical protein
MDLINWQADFVIFAKGFPVALLKNVMVALTKTSDASSCK